MEPRKHSVDLGKELTCSICTELLYQPLTLLDCLHTNCGACLKEWFRFQAAKIERAPTPPPPDAVLFTCPSCRSSVRDTRHNATVATLLEMYVAANPSKARSETDKKEMSEKYKPGDQIIPKIKTRERTKSERRAEEEDRRLVDQVREMSLREAVAAATPVTPLSRPSRRRDSHGEERARSSTDQRRTRNGRENGLHGSADQIPVDGDPRDRSRRSESRQRHIEHQSSLRSLIGSQMNERDIEREIEEFARQIQEEGLLDGLDLDNIDLSRDDELSRRITEAYRRRQRDRSRQEPARRSNASGQNEPRHPVDSRSADSRLRPDSARQDGRQRTHSRSTSEAENRNRPPVSSSGNLEVREPPRRTRRRTTSGGRSATTPVLPSTSDAQPAARSQTDLTLRSQTSDPITPVPPLRINRSTSSGAVPPPAQAVELPASGSTSTSSFANRLPAGNQSTSNPGETATSELVELAATRTPRPNRPPELDSSNTHLVASPIASPTASGYPRARPQLFEEPSISCSRCNKPHIEYELHYNCKLCKDGQWNICIGCYRAGKGCLYWFGFGYGAWKNWERQKQGDDSVAKPHMLNAGRYIPPTVPPTSSNNGKMVTPEDPKSRLETGTFCSKCFAWTNDCFWRCDVCNEGDWGFCNNCVNQGNSCTHKLLPLAHEVTFTKPNQSRASRSPSRPVTATMNSGPQTVGIGPFKPLTFNTRCDICNNVVPPSQLRYHCFSCKSALVPDAAEGDYDICSPCYVTLEAQGKISAENGQAGWRRCLNGHRMAIIGFAEGKIGYQRYVERDIVGGRALRSQPLENIAVPDFEKWSWVEGTKKLERIVSIDVSLVAPTTLGSISYAQSFPPDGGAGLTGHAIWAWYPKPEAGDELMFPRGADIKEMRDINGDWLFGTFMGAKGVFPAHYALLPPTS